MQTTVFRGRPLRIGASLAVLLAGLITTGHTRPQSGLTTGSVGQLAGELVVRGDDGVRQAIVTATNSYDIGTKTGSAHLEIQRSGDPLATMSAQLTAETPEEAAAAVTALILKVTGRTPSGGSTLRLSDVRFEGDRRALGAMAEEVMAWWDANATLVFEGYRSPALFFFTPGTLHLNVWGKPSLGNEPRPSYAILFFDPLNPTSVIGGTVVVPDSGIHATVTSGSLVAKTDTPGPGDFILTFAARPDPNTSLGSAAELAIAVLDDDSIDVRGVAMSWAGESGSFLVEGVGNRRFVVPSQ